MYRANDLQVLPTELSQTQPTPTFAVLGPGVVDSQIRAEGPMSSSKVTSSIVSQIGGGVVHVSRSAKGCEDVSVTPVVLIGDDEFGEQIIEEIGSEFSEAVFDRCFTQTRRSIILPDGTCYTTRPSLNRNEVPEPMRERLQAADAVVVCPFSSNDFDFVNDALVASGNALLMLSADQLRDPKAAFRLMRMASVSVLNDSEAKILTGKSQPVDAIHTCRDSDCANIIVTTETGAIGFVDGNWVSASPVTSAKVVRTVGAGDMFAGCFAAARLLNNAPDESIRLGQVAARRFVTGERAVGLSLLRNESKQIAAFRPSPEKRERASYGSIFEPRKIALTGFGLTIAVVIGFLLG